jgi:glyoxylase-like metal-dependent hydrolase (beta-lactamase superfamily II)
MHKLTFFPLGNADCCLINLDDGSKILFDYANQRDHNDKEYLRIDLPDELHKILDEDDADEFDVVAFTHLDKDHFAGATEFFYLEHAEKYQDNDR